MVKICVSGAINWDINLFVQRFAEIGEEVPITEITKVPGGKAANVAVAAARILGAGQTAIIGCLGKDSIAEKQIKILKDEGVVVRGIKITEKSNSGQAYIVIDKEGRNIINTYFGANLNLLAEDFGIPDIMSLIQESSIVTLIDPPLKALESVVLEARTKEKILLWDVGVRSILGMKKLSTILQNIDYLLVNRIEMKNLTKQTLISKSWESVSKISKDLKMIVKLGADGCSMISSDYTIEVPSINLKNLGLKVVNTVGCGDAFLGVFAASKAQRLGDIEALERANLAGALKASHFETRGSPTIKELEKFLNLKSSARIL